MSDNRNNNIDFFRGLAALGVIFIHTVFWSGGNIAPVWLKSLSLIIDVPLFILIYVMIFNSHKSVIKTLKGLIKFYKVYLVFYCLFFAIIFLIDKTNFTHINLVRGLFFLLPSDTPLLVVQGSFWFIYMFFAVSILSSFIIKIYNNYNKDFKNFKYILILVFILYGMKLYLSEFHFLNIQTLFYLFIYLLGYYLYNYKISFGGFVFGEMILLVVLYSLTRFNDYGFMAMQTAKFDYHINYMVYSIVSILVVFYFKDRIKMSCKNVFSFMGRNALLFYFCQGLGTSFNYYFLDILGNINEWGKITILFLVNTLTTFILVLILKGLIKLLDNICDFIKKTKFFETILVNVIVKK